MWIKHQWDLDSDAWQWPGPQSADRKTILIMQRSKCKQWLLYSCFNIFENCKVILKGVMCLNTFCIIKKNPFQSRRPSNRSDCPSNSFILLFFSPPWRPPLSSLPSLHQSDRWRVLDEAGRSLWALWRRMTMTRWMTSTQTKTLSAPRYASSLHLNTQCSFFGNRKSASQRQLVTRHVTMLKCHHSLLWPVFTRYS